MSGINCNYNDNLGQRLQAHDPSCIIDFHVNHPT